MLQRELVSWSLKMKLHSARKKFHNACNLWRVSNWCQNNINCKDFVMLTSSFCEGTRGVSHPKLNRKIIYGDKGKLWDKWGTWRSAPFNSRTEHPIPTGYETDGPWASWNAEGGGGTSKSPPEIESGASSPQPIRCSNWTIMSPAK
jgi:hypothetical protein